MGSLLRNGLCSVAVASLALVVFVFHASAQAPPPLSTGSVQNVVLYNGGQCPAGFMGFPMVCYQAQITGCPSADAWSLIFGFAAATNANGLVVFFNGEGGTSPDTPKSQDKMFATSYFGSGYSVVQTKWMADWEYLTNPANTNPRYNIQLAACRPATFLWWARNNTMLFNGNPMFPANNPLAGMCAQGFSAGSAAISYALAWYNAGAPTSQGGAALDKAILNVGPVLSHIGAGCVDNPNNPNINMCASGQPYCNGWGSGVAQSDAYVQGTEDFIVNWTGDSSCQSGNYTQPSYDNWEDQSIMNSDSLDPQPLLSYPSTGVSSYLCAGPYQSGSANESSPQGWEFLSNITPLYLAVSAVSKCNGAEGFLGTTMVPAEVLWQGQLKPSATIIQADMVSGVIFKSDGSLKTAACTRSPGH